MPSLDRQQFGELFTRSARVLWVVAAAWVPRHAVDDVLQEAAMHALERLDRFQPGTDFCAWMTQLVRHVAANQRRRAQRLPEPRDEIDLALPAPTPVPIGARGDLNEQQTDFDDRVLAALRQVSDDARACLLLHAVLGLRHADIGHTLDLPEGTVASHIHRARHTLRTALRATTSTEPIHRGARP